MKQPRKPIEALTPSPQPTARRLIPAPSSPLSLEDVDWSSISCSEQDTCRMSHSPLSSECSQGDDAGYIKLPSPDCNLGRPLVYLGSFLGLLCAVGGVATATFVLSGGPHVGAAIDEAAGFDRADSDMGIEPVAAPRITAGPSRMLSTKPASLDDYDEAGMNVAYIDKTVEENKLKLWSQNDEEDLPSAYEMRKYADELMRHSNEFAKFRTNQTTAPQTVSVTRPAKKQGAAKGRNLPIWRDQPATTVPATHTTDCRSTVLPPSQAPLSSGEGSARPLPTGNDKMASSSTATQSEGRVKSIESGGMSSDVDSDVTPSGRIAPAATRGLLAALPLPTKAHGPGPRSLICLVEGGGVRPGPPLHECSHLILGNQVLDLVQRVIRPARRGSSDREPLGMTTAAMAEQVRALRAESAPGIRILAGLRSMEVENTYVHLWSNQSGLAASANLAYEWVRRAGLDGIALTNVVLGRHTVDVYEGFLKRLRALFREDYLIVFGFFHRESHEHDHVYTENAIRTIVRLCSFTVFEAHDVRPRSCRSFVLNALNDYRNAISNATIVSSLATIRSLGVPLDQTCVSMSLAVMRFLLYDRPRRLGQVCHNYFAEAYSMDVSHSDASLVVSQHCREWTEIRYERGAVSNTALVHRRATAAAEIMDSFDNETTLTHKVKALVRNTGIPCVAVYNVELDDATGVCESETPYSRLTAVATALRGTTLTKRTTAAPPKLKPRKAIAGDHSTAEPSPATAAPHPRHRVRKRVVVAVKKRRHQQAS